MIPPTDFSKLHDLAAAAEHPAWSAFKAEMTNRCYGREALNDAWAWFELGWDRNVPARAPETVGGEVVSPVPMVIHCPECRTRHIDEGEFATKVHHTHSCQGCGLTWRPAVVATVGVQFLPGFKNESPATPATPSPVAQDRQCARECAIDEGVALADGVRCRVTYKPGRLIRSTPLVKPTPSPVGARETCGRCNGRRVVLLERHQVRNWRDPGSHFGPCPECRDQDDDALPPPVGAPTEAEACGKPMADVLWAPPEPKATCTLPKGHPGAHAEASGPGASTEAEARQACSDPRGHCSGYECCHCGSRRPPSAPDGGASPKETP